MLGFHTLILYEQAVGTTPAEKLSGRKVIFMNKENNLRGSGHVYLYSLFHSSARVFVYTVRVLMWYNEKASYVIAGPRLKNNLGPGNSIGIPDAKSMTQPRLCLFN